MRSVQTGAGRVIVTRAPGDDGLRWRLVAGNGRALGMSAATFADAAAALRDVDTLAARIDGVTPTVAHAVGTSGWVWRLQTPDGQVLAVSHRSFERHGSCERSAVRFVDVVAHLHEEA